MSDGDKNSVISKVVNSIISLPVYASTTLMARKSILTKLKRDIYGKNGIGEWEVLNRRKNDQKWIEDRRTDLNEIYDIEGVKLGKKLMNTLDENPWKVKSIKDFSCLKCPECIFFTKEQNYFEDHAIANHPLSAILFDEITSSYEIEDNFKEEVLDEINHVNVGDIKKEPIDQDTSEDPFDICDTNIKQEDENFMSSSPNKHVTSDNELSLNYENKPKKLNIEQSEVRIVVFNSSQHVTPREKRINCQNYRGDIPIPTI